MLGHPVRGGRTGFEQAGHGPGYEGLSRCTRTLIRVLDFARSSGDFTDWYAGDAEVTDLRGDT